MKTVDYGIFKNINGNREITPAHVVGLATAIERKNLLEHFPLLVNERMEIIDGQHRLMAAVKLGVPIYYDVIPGLHIEDIMSINTHSKNWSVHDFIEAYIRLGQPDYQELKDFMARHHMTATMSAAMLQGYAALTGGGKVSQAIKNGTFRIASRPYAEEIMAKLQEVDAFCDFPAKRDRFFISTIAVLRNNEDFDWDKFIAKLRMHGLRVGSRGTVDYYLLHIEELYNFNAKVKTELYASSKQLVRAW